MYDSVLLYVTLESSHTLYLALSHPIPFHPIPFHSIELYSIKKRFESRAYPGYFSLALKEVTHIWCSKNTALFKCAARASGAKGRHLGAGIILYPVRCPVELKVSELSTFQNLEIEEITVWGAQID